MGPDHSTTLWQAADAFGSDSLQPATFQAECIKNERTSFDTLPKPKLWPHGWRKLEMRFGLRSAIINLPTFHGGELVP